MIERNHFFRLKSYLLLNAKKFSRVDQMDPMDPMDQIEDLPERMCLKKHNCSKLPQAATNGSSHEGVKLQNLRFAVKM